MGRGKPAVSELALPWVSGLRPYSPGMTVEELQRRHRVASYAKLASNENPLGPSPKALRAITEGLPLAGRYPDGSGRELRAALGLHLGVSPERIILGNGSNEIIELIARAFLSQGDEAVVSEFSFVIYQAVVRAAGAQVKVVPARNFGHDLAAMVEAVGERTKMIFLANPNNPTGTIYTREEWEAFIDGVPPRVVLVVDEAYAEFVSAPVYPDSISSQAGGKWILTLRTFSKIYGLAGLRIGYGVGDPQLIELVNRVRQPFNVNTLAQLAAVAALSDREHVARTMENNRVGIEFLKGELSRLGLGVVPSWANFLLFEVGEARQVYQKLLERGVIVRPMDVYGLGRYLRVSVGTPEENRFFIDKLEEVLRQ